MCKGSNPWSMCPVSCHWYTESVFSTYSLRHSYPEQFDPLVASANTVPKRRNVIINVWRTIFGGFNDKFSQRCDIDLLWQGYREARRRTFLFDNIICQFIGFHNVIILYSTKHLVPASYCPCRSTAENRALPSLLYNFNGRIGSAWALAITDRDQV